MIAKCSNLVYHMTLGYPRNDMVLRLKGQGHKVNKYILTNNYYAYVNVHLTDNSNTSRVCTLECLLVTQYIEGLNSMSVF